MGVSSAHFSAIRAFPAPILPTTEYARTHANFTVYSYPLIRTPLPTILLSYSRRSLLPYCNAYDTAVARKLQKKAIAGMLC